jgi:hypothetical protein
MERLPDAQVQVELKPRLLAVELVGELDLDRVRIYLNNGAFTPLEKIAQAVSTLGVAKPQ